MSPAEREVKARTYDASGRRAAAEARRTHVLDTAGMLFLRDGYAATTVPAVAQAAGVSPETVYKGFGGKAGLVRALHARALEGAGTVPAEARSDALARAAKAVDVIAGWAALTTEVAPRVAPLLLLVRDAAASDPEMRDLSASLERTRHRRMRSNARVLADRGFLRPAVSVAEAADVMYVVTSPELYELLVLRRRWSAARFGDYVRRHLSDALIDRRLLS